MHCCQNTFGIHCRHTPQGIPTALIRQDYRVHSDEYRYLVPQQRVLVLSAPPGSTFQKLRQVQYADQRDPMTFDASHYPRVL